MTTDVINFIEGLGLHGATLDVGSFDVNGSVRHLFDDYIGLDMRAGKNVDVVANAAHLPFTDSVFDNVLCLEMLEHDATFWVTVQELKRVLKPGGVLVVTTPSIGFPHHEYPHDYWRFTADALLSLLQGMEDAHAWVIEGENRAYAICRKPL